MVLFSIYDLYLVINKANARLKSLDLMQKEYSNKIKEEIAKIDRIHEQELHLQEQRRQEIFNKRRKIGILIIFNLFS